MIPKFLVAEAWKLGINDPTIIAWFIFVVYFGIAWQCFSARISNPSTKASWFLWILLGSLLVVLGFNKQLDLHTLLFQYVDRSLNADTASLTSYAVFALIGIFSIFLFVFVARGLLNSTWRLRFAYGTLVGILSLQVVRFLPGPLSPILVSHVFTDNEDSLLHVHWIEILELASLIIIGVLAWLGRNPRGKTKVASETD